MSTASIAVAQPLANPGQPVREKVVATDNAAGQGRAGNFIQPRVGIQAAYTDNITSVSTNPQSDQIGRLNIGADAKYSAPRLKLNLSADAFLEQYAKHKEYNTVNYNGSGNLSYTVVDNFLALEAAGARTQGSLTTFGTTDFYRSSSADDYQVSTYFVGPHVTFSPGIFDVSAAARYGQVFYDGPEDPSFATLAPTTSIYQMIGAADTKDRLGRVRFVASGQYERTEDGFESTSGSVSSFYNLAPRFTAIARAGYDDTRVTSTMRLKAPFWSVGGQYTLGDDTYVRLEGGQRYDEPYYAGSAFIHFARAFYLIANYTDTLEPGAISISNVLVDYVGGLDEPLPIPVAPPPFQLTSNFYNTPSINRTGDVQLLGEFGRQTISVGITSLRQKYLTQPAKNETLTQNADYTINFRPDLSLSLRYLWANEDIKSQATIGPLTTRKGRYAVGTAAVRYNLNRAMTLLVMYQRRDFQPKGSTLLEEYVENIGSIALTRKF